MFSDRNAKGSVLVTGGAGYIGSHTCKSLAASGFLPVAYDDLSIGNSGSVRWGPLIVGDISDAIKVADAIAKYNIYATIHLAACAYVSESFTNPRKYFITNIAKTISLLNTLLDSGVHQIVFSSTCAVYGLPETLPMREDHPQRPANPYGESKLAIEKILKWYGEAYGVRWTSLRYFNAAGADPNGEIGECHREETHLIPSAIQATVPGSAPLHIFGTDYPTRDGTAIRDYIHVTDLADAHVLALRYVDSGKQSAPFNLGTGTGYSVNEVLEVVSQIMGRPPITVEAGCRPGDVPELVADPSRARCELRWSPRHSDLNTIVKTAAYWFNKSRRALTQQAGVH